MRLWRRHKHVFEFDYILMGHVFERCACGAQMVQPL